MVVLDSLGEKAEKEGHLSKSRTNGSRKSEKTYSLAISYHLPCISTLTIFKDFARVSTKSAFSRCE